MAEARELGRLVGLDGLGPAGDIALGPVLLETLGAFGPRDLVRVHTPRPTAAFSRRDTLRPGFARATEAARSHGFEPVVRSPGGRLAAYRQGCLVVDRVCADDDARGGIEQRFVRFGEVYVGALRALGLDARVGEVEGEYCPGRFSVNVAGTHKVVGTAQRITRAGWLFSASVVVRDPEPVRAVLRECYEALEYDWRPETVGALSGWVPDLQVSDLADRLLEGLRSEGSVVPTSVPAEVLDRVRERAADHAVPADVAAVRPRLTSGRVWSAISA